MRIPHSLLPALRTGVLLAFVLVCALIFGYLWLGAGGRIPLVSGNGYRVSVPLADVDNLVQESDVKRAGVDVGKVVDVTAQGDQAVALLQLDPDAGPLHQGAVVTVHNKSLIEETYLDITDGTGPTIADGAELPPSAGRSSVQLDDVLASLSPETRASLGSLLRSSGLATANSRQNISRAVAGLGEVGRQGGDALTALAAQSQDLRELTVNTTDLLGALDTQQGRVADLVTDSEKVFRTTAQSRSDIEALMRRLPPLLSTAQDAGGSLTALAGKLAPVAANLRGAAPDLSAALQELPATSADLRGLLPSLDSVLDRAPDTLNRVPTLGADVRAIVPTLQVNLSDLNPALQFLQPYGCDIAAFFTNFSASVGPDDGNGNIFRILFLFNEQSVNQPLNTNIGPLTKRNSVPAPCTGADPNPRGDQQQAYPRVAQEPVPQ
jgi:phospholipid/cholesterol/gamma-HCH transport system substrate-binding protein